MENKQIHRAVVIWTNACRFLLAVVFMFSGFIKANDPLGTVYKVQDYLEAWGLLSLKSGALPYVLALAVGVFEFALGIYLLFGIRCRLAPFLTLLVMCFMTPLTLWLAISNPISDCGCFGDAVVLTNWETFAKNVVLLIAAVSVFRGSRHLFKLVTDKVDWLVALYSFVFIIFFSTFTFRHLPVFDFRPYHIGSDIREKMEIPEGEKPSVLETVFIYAKEGKEQVFTIDNLPGDTTWTFVDSKTIVKEKGYEPPIQDFHIVSQEDGLELTDTILGDDNYTFLLVAAWQENTGAEYPFALADEITLKTMIRSNPGLMLLKKGVVINKWSSASIPDEYQLNAPLEKLPLAHLSRKTLVHRILEVVGWFVGPLLLFTAADLIWLQIKARRRRAVSKTEQEKLE